MKIRWLAALAAIALWCTPPAWGQNAASGNISASSTNCFSVSPSCVWESALPPNASTSTVNISGTFNETLVVELSNNAGQTWSLASTLTAPGTTTYSVNGFTDIRVRGSVSTSGTAAVTISTGLLQVQSVVGGFSSPSSLTTYFNGFMGLSPKDAPYNAVGDWKLFFDCGMASNNHVTCTTGHFAAANVGKSFEIFTGTSGGGVPTSVIAGTITAFNSATDVTVSQTAGSTFTNQRLGFGTDDSAAMTAWAAGLAAAGSVHQGYIPLGNYYYKTPLTITNTNLSGNNAGECGPAPANTSMLGCPLGITGAGPGMSNLFFATASQANWGASTVQGALMVTGWATGVNLNNFSLFGDQSNQVTTNQTLMAGGLVLNKSSHANVYQLWIEGFRTATLRGIAGLASYNDFESNYYNLAIESNDTNLWVSGDAASCTAGPAAPCTKLLFDTLHLENGFVNMRFGNTNSNTGPILSFSQIRFRNMHYLSPTGVQVVIETNVRMNTNISGTTGNDGMTFEASRFTSNVNEVGFQILSGGTNTGRTEFQNCYFENTSGNAASALITNLGTPNWEVWLFGGALNNVAAGAAYNVSGGGILRAYGTKITGNRAGTAFTFEPTATGWNGLGTLENTAVYSDQGTALSNGSIGTLTGWGTGASAAVCATPQPGFSQTGCFTITSGSASFLAAPTVTVTLPNALPTANTICTLDVIDITGAGGAIIWKQTTNSATAPVFTAKTNTGTAFTPAASETYTMILRCGP